ncbi:MAG: hypothetical protein IT384_15110 [Deltaproteobacteria bacterium]|jgi:hypothetical protein|nr:hypothetical protein [Deltaproteobacteria bacterium]
MKRAETLVGDGSCRKTASGSKEGFGVRKGNEAGEARREAKLSRDAKEL